MKVCATPLKKKQDIGNLARIEFPFCAWKIYSFSLDTSVPNFYPYFFYNGIARTFYRGCSPLFRYWISIIMIIFFILVAFAFLGFVLIFSLVT